MVKIAHFYAKNHYINFLEYRALYSFWRHNQEVKITLYFPHKEENKKKPNHYWPTFEFCGRQTEVFFDKLGYKGEDNQEDKKAYLKQYVLKQLGGLWLDGDRIYYDNLEGDPDGLQIDITENIQNNKKLDLNTSVGVALSLLNDRLIFDAIDFYSNEGSILDIGCGDKTMQQTLNNQNITSVDNWEKFNPDLMWDLNNTPLPYEDNSFDTVLALDLIEHLDRDKGEVLLKDLKRIARKNILLLTPLYWTDNTQNVDNPESPYYQNPYDLHRSQWTVDDFSDFKRITDKKYYKDFFFGVWEKI